MKYFLIFSLVAMFTCKASAQQTVEEVLKGKANAEEPAMPTRQAVDHKGADVYIYDVVTRYKVLSSSLTFLYVGGKYPNQLVTVLIKGLKANKECINARKGKWHFSGVMTSYKGKPAIVVNNAVQLGTRIQI